MEHKDVIARDPKQSWFYTETVKDHFFHPRNFMEEESAYGEAYLGMVGSPACGDVMKIWIKVDPSTKRITDLKWQTFGCASAIASTSMMSVIVTENGGMTLEQARQLKPQTIMERLGGLPLRKVHCSVLGDKALRAAINDYYRKHDQPERIEVEHGRIIDKELKITDHDIEEAVLEGAHTLEAVQQKTKVGTGNPSCLPEVEQLIRFYKDKHFSQYLGKDEG
ncbi:iron-sulfur cluster assembly scaffold protein [Candidatus Uhrbacteria bacterium]|nr:iron-sulfur cluster assembly scaffold protein [Candidatus Uhrbacteria bacterium]MBD3284603.1 iron-sulfur cluster assembly scaffold protein [Candidatus Uhrbacteria bacterium]